MKCLICILAFFLVCSPVFGETEGLGTVVISATKDESLLEDYPGNVDIITREEIEQMPVRNVAELLKQVAGMEVYKRSEHDFVVDARGFNNGAGNGSRIILLIDGIPVKNGDSGTLDWSLVNLNDIEKIEILRGNVASQYGDGATGGIINIITSDKKHPSSSIVELTYGSYNKLNGFWGVNKALDTGFLSFKFDYRSSDGYRDNSDYEQKNIKFTASHFLNERTEIIGNFDYGEAYYNYPGALKKEGGQLPDTDPGSLTSQNFKIVLFSGNLTHYYTETAKINMLVAYKDRKYEYTAYNMKFHNKITMFECQTMKEFKKHFYEDKLLGGFDLKKEEIYSSSLETTSKLSGTYLQNNLSLFKKIMLHTGYRFDLVENSYKNIVPKHKKTFKLDHTKVGLLWKIKKNNELYANWGKSFRSPIQDEIFNYSTGTLNIIQPEKANNYELGASAQPAKFLKLNSALFYIIVENEILYDYDQYINRNFKEIVHEGIEIRSEIIPYKLINLNVSHTYQKIHFTKGEYKGKTVPLSPAHKFSGLISLFPFKGFTVSHISYWRDKCFSVNDLNNDFKKYKAYWVSDLKIMYGNKKAKLEFGIYNFYNERYAEFPVIGTDWWTFEKFEAIYPSPRRNYEISASLYF